MQPNSRRAKAAAAMPSLEDQHWLAGYETTAQRLPTLTPAEFAAETIAIHDGRGPGLAEGRRRALADHLAALENDAPPFVPADVTSSRTKRILLAAVRRGYGVTPSINTPGCFAVHRLERSEFYWDHPHLNVYAEDGNRCEIYLIDDSNGKYDRITQRDAHNLIEEQGL